MEYLSFGFLDRFKTSTYVPVSSATLLIYDTLLTFPDEIRYVWGSTWSVGKCLYILSRYPILLNSIVQFHRNTGHDVSHAECHTLYTLTGYMYIFGAVAAEAILVVRVWALWKRRKSIAWILSCMTVIAMGIALFAVFDLQVGEIFVPRDVIQSLSYPGCVFVSSKSSDHAIASYVVLMAYECGIFALMIVNGVVNHLSFPSSSSLMYNFYKDGFMYFLTLIVASVINLIITVTQPPEYTNLLISTQAALHSILSCRILLDVRYRSEHSQRNVSITPRFESVDATRRHIAAGSFGTRSIRPNHRAAETQGMAWFGHGSQVVSDTSGVQSEVIIDLRVIGLRGGVNAS